MFKKFSREDGIANTTQAKTSVQRNIKKQLQQDYSGIESILDTDELFPKKAPVYIVKCHGHLSLCVCQGQVLFWQAHDKTPWLPTLRILHRYPDLLPRVRVDRGAIKFVLKGADVMAPGLTSKGGALPTELPANTCVCIEAEGKEHALAIGRLTMSTGDIAKINKNVACENLHYLNDGLWNIGTID